MTRDELKIIAKQLRRAAQVIDAVAVCDHERPCRLAAEHALLVTKGWQLSLTGTGGPGPKGGHSDPTLAAVLRGPDKLAHLHDQLTKRLRDAYLAAADLTAQLVDINGSPLVEATRAGIGHCEDCGRYCDGATDNTRLRVGLCNACRKAPRNAKVSA